MAAHSSLDLPEGRLGSLDAQTRSTTRRPSTYPHGDLDPRGGRRPRHPRGARYAGSSRWTTAESGSTPSSWRARYHGGLADGLGMALMQAITFDADGNCLGGSFMDYRAAHVREMPVVGACRTWLPRAIRPSHRRQGSRRIGHGGLARRGGQRGHGRAPGGTGCGMRTCRSRRRTSGPPSRAAADGPGPHMSEER